MPIRSFTVFQDQDASSTPITTTFTGPCTRDTPLVATKENVNPLTGLAFDSKPPLKKRKPSSSSALKVKALPSSSRSKSKKSSSTNTARDKAKLKVVLGASGSKNMADRIDWPDAEAEQSRTALGNRNAYNLTVMPLADVTQAYDVEGTSSMIQLGKCAMEIGEHFGEHCSMEMPLHEFSEENNVEMCDTTSKETQTSFQAAQA